MAGRAVILALAASVLTVVTSRTLPQSGSETDRYLDRYLLALQNTFSEATKEGEEEPPRQYPAMAFNNRINTLGSLSNGRQGSREDDLEMLSKQLQRRAALDSLLWKKDLNAVGAIYWQEDGLKKIKRQPPRGFHGVRGRRDVSKWNRSLAGQV